MGSSDIRINANNLDFWALAVIVLLGFALYICPLKSNSFCFDDVLSVRDNTAIYRVDIPKIFHAFNTRFLVGLSFALNYHWSGLNPSGYRAVNLIIHCLNAFLVYLLMKFILYSQPKIIFFCRLEWLAFLGSLLFLCHPIQTEPVNFITQRFVLMGTFFYLLTLYLYVQYRHTMQIAYMAASIASAIAAMFCKEFVVTLPLMIALYDFYFLDAKNETIWIRCRRLIPFFIIALIVPFLLLRTPSTAIGVANIAASSAVQEGGSPKIARHIDITRANGSIGRKQYFLTEVNVMCTYVRLLFLPIDQNLDYDYPVSSALDGKTVICGIFLLCLLGMAWLTYESYRVISFGILWFFIALSVESSFIPIGDVIVEYRLYLASVSLVFLVMALIYLKQDHQKKSMMAIAAILIGFSILTFQRNKVWKDDLALWNDTVSRSPHKARVYVNRGMAYFKQGDSAKALSDLNKAIEINAKDAGVYYNRGYIYDVLGNNTMAMSDYNKAIEINPNYVSAYVTRSSIYATQGDFTRAIFDLNKAIELNPNLALLYYNRGSIYAKQGEFTPALFDYNKAIEINPDDTDAYNNRFIIYEILTHEVGSL